VPGIERLAKETRRPKLAISLNASSDAQRDALMRSTRNIRWANCSQRAGIFRVARASTLRLSMFCSGHERHCGRREACGSLMADLCRVKVNLIPWNPGSLPYKEPSEEAIERFHKILLEKGIPAFTRYSRGRDVMAAAGNCR